MYLPWQMDLNTSNFFCLLLKCTHKQSKGAFPHKCTVFSWLPVVARLVH